MNKCPLLKETTQSKANCWKDLLQGVIGTNPSTNETVRGMISRCHFKKKITLSRHLLDRVRIEVGRTITPELREDIDKFLEESK
jgi:hypothetical protein